MPPFELDALPPIETYDVTTVGLIELLFLAGIVVTVELSQSMIALAMSSPTAPGLRLFGASSPPEETGKEGIDDVPGSTPNPGSTGVMGWRAGTPLPSLTDLVQACHLVAEDANGKSWFLCAQPDGACTPDEDFTAHYGQPVFVCRV